MNLLAKFTETCPLCSAEAESKDLSAAKTQDHASGAKQPLEDADMMQVTSVAIMSCVVAPECAPPHPHPFKNSLRLS
jgi:hypothetical protein